MLRTLAGLLFAVLPASLVIAQAPPSNFVVDVLVQNLNSPNDLCFLPGGRVLVAHGGGNVTLYANGATSVIGTVPNVQTGGEGGMLSIEVDPDFSANGYIYVLYSWTGDSFLHCDRYTCTGDISVPDSTNLSFSAASRRTVLSSLPDVFNEHNGGSVRFGPDGMLYLVVGDDVDPCAAQDIDSKCGCLLRMDVSQLGPSPGSAEPAYSTLDPGDNPFSSSTGFRQLVIAMGLRNPFRMEIDPVTGDIFIADVGGGLREEISRYAYNSSGLVFRNFGWPWREGNMTGAGCGGSMPPGLIWPILSVPHGVGGASIMAGSVYRNCGGNFDFPSSYDGCLFYFDFFTGNVRRIEPGTGGSWVASPPAPGQPTSNDWANNIPRLTSLRQGPDGALWYTRYPFAFPTGLLGRIRHVGSPAVVTAVSGGEQIASAGDDFLEPVVVRVTDSSGSPIANADVGFQVVGPAELIAPHPLQTGPNGEVRMELRALDGSGEVTVLATTPGDTNTLSFPLFSRRLTATSTTNSLNLSLQNTTQAVPANIQYIMMMSFPGSPTLPTFFGDLCIDPNYALAVVIEDGTGAFNFVSFSGGGGVGNPSLNNSYFVPPGLLDGQLMSFQAVGFDPVDGWFRTNCEQHQF